jgi:hypothetical protein
MGLSDGFLHGSNVATSMRKNLLCVHSRLWNARLGRQRLAAAISVTAVISTAASAAGLARRLHRPTPIDVRPSRGNCTAPTLAAGTTALFTGRGAASAPQCRSQKPCRSYRARLSYLPIQAHDYYTTTTRPSPALLTPRKTGPRVIVPVRISHSITRSIANSSSSPPRNPNLFQVSSSVLHTPSLLRSFSTSLSTMAAIKLDGTAIAKSIREKLAAEVVEKQKLNPQYQPCLKIIQG